LNVVFQDEDGNEITRYITSSFASVEGIDINHRVGKRGRQGHGSYTGKSAPIVVHDEFGKELYRY
jgi:hypothetical protein